MSAAFEKILATAQHLGLNAVPRGTHLWMRCPVHNDHTPSLCITEGRRAFLIKCWAGCALKDICSALGLHTRDLFYDQDIDPRQLQQRRRQRERERQQQAREQRKLGRLLDACKAAERYLESRQPVDINAWSDDRLNHELNRLADAYHILEHDPYAAHC